jgi:TatD DNase family protein
MIHWTDAHTHLDSGELFAAKESVLTRAGEAGVSRLLLVNSEATKESLEQTVLCRELDNPVKRYLSFGVHPHHAALYNETLEKLVLYFLALPGVVAFGEIGLDFYYDYSPRKIQADVLKRQLKLAVQRALPVVIHCRDAYAPLAEILKSEAEHWRGMIHCFTGTPEEAEALLALGFHISFSGIVTFKNAEVLRRAALAVPPDRILIETDAPYLAPVPFRGKTNEPAYVAHTGRFVAELRRMSHEEFAGQVNANFNHLFQLVD